MHQIAIRGIRSREESTMFIVRGGGQNYLQNERKEFAELNEEVAGQSEQLGY